MKIKLILLIISIIGSGVAVAIPPCGSQISDTFVTEHSCQLAGANENCSGLPFGYGANFEVSRSVEDAGYTNGYIYTCTTFGRDGSCCTGVADPLPSCPASTCWNGGVGGGGG